jgi:CBS domain
MLTFITGPPWRDPLGSEPSVMYRETAPEAVIDPLVGGAGVGQLGLLRCTTHCSAAAVGQERPTVQRAAQWHPHCSLSNVDCPKRVARGTRFQARRGLTMREILNMTVGELMSKSVVTVTPETSIASLRQIMAEHDFNGFPVVNDSGVLLGMVTRLDLFRIYLLPYAKFIPALEDTWVSSVGAIMSRGVIALIPGSRRSKRWRS